VRTPRAPPGALPDGRAGGATPARPRSSAVRGTRSARRRPPGRLARALGAALGAARWRSGRWVCFEPGQIIDARRFRQFAAVYHAGRQGESLEGHLIGSVRPDAKFGVGRQFFDFGRFLPYPVAEGGTCGLPGGPAGVALSRETLFARRDLGPARTIVAGVAGPRVRRLELGAAPVPLSPRRAFIAVRRGRRAVRDLPLVVTYRDGAVRRF